MHRSLLQEGRDSLQLLREAYPTVAGLQEKYGERLASAEAAAAAARGQAEFDAIRRQGTGVYDTLTTATPLLGDAATALRAEIGQAGASEIEEELRRQALAELRLGGELDAYDRREAVQGARAAFQSRGLQYSSPAAVGEVLARTGMAQQRADQRRAFAGQVEGLTTAREGADRSFLLNTLNTGNAVFDPQQRLFGSGGSVVSGTAASTPSFDNALAAAGNVAAGNQAASLAAYDLYGQQQMQQAEFAHDTAMTKLNAGYASDISAANNKAGVTSGALAAGGAVAAGLAIAF